MSKLEFPTEIIELPSKGLVYPESNPLSKGTIELKIPTGKEENILSSKQLIKNNTVISRFLKSLIVDKSINLDDMIIGDVNALIYASRILAYGPIYSVNIKCPICGNVSKLDIDIDAFESTKFDESLLNRENLYQYTFKKSNINITHRLMTYGLEEQVNKEIKQSKKLEKLTGVNRELTLRNAIIITDIDGEDLPENPHERLMAIDKILNNKIPSIDLREFRHHLKEMQPNIDTTFYYECSECNYETDSMEVELDTNFFWPST